MNPLFPTFRPGDCGRKHSIKECVTEIAAPADGHYLAPEKTTFHKECVWKRDGGTGLGSSDRCFNPEVSDVEFVKRTS